MTRSFLIALILTFVSVPAFASALIIENAWSPQAPPGRMMAGFMQLENRGDGPITLIRGESDRFGRVEIHSMRMDDGIMRMRKLDALEIPAGERIELGPGGLHLMLMEPTGRFKPGDRFELELIDSAGNSWTASLAVRERRR